MIAWRILETRRGGKGTINGKIHWKNTLEKKKKTF